MRKLKGLRLIVIGLFLLVSWIAFYTFLDYQFLPNKSSTPFLSVVWLTLVFAVESLASGIPLGLWPLTGLILLVCGLFYCARSLLRSRQ